MCVPDEVPRSFCNYRQIVVFWKRNFLSHNPNEMRYTHQQLTEYNNCIVKRKSSSDMQPLYLHQYPSYPFQRYPGVERIYIHKGIISLSLNADKSIFFMDANYVILFDSSSINSSW